MVNLLKVKFFMSVRETLYNWKILFLQNAVYLLDLIST